MGVGIAKDSLLCSLLPPFAVPLSMCSPGVSMIETVWSTARHGTWMHNRRIASSGGSLNRSLLIADNCSCCPKRKRHGDELLRKAPAINWWLQSSLSPRLGH
eukprot:4330160-Amphidinium_carterae.1